MLLSLCFLGGATASAGSGAWVHDNDRQEGTASVPSSCCLQWMGDRKEMPLLQDGEQTVWTLIDRVGYRWICQLVALLIYAVLLMPGFIRVGYYYFFSSQVLRSVVYGDQPRNRLVLYIPRDRSKSNPVVAFVTGGAWIIGYKAWGALLGRHLAERGIMVACIDYRNFPQGTISDMVSDASFMKYLNMACRNFPQGIISDMVSDASEGISFICDTVASYGGDPNQQLVFALLE